MTDRMRRQRLELNLQSYRRWAEECEQQLKNLDQQERFGDDVYESGHVLFWNRILDGKTYYYVARKATNGRWGVSGNTLGTISWKGLVRLFENVDFQGVRQMTGSVFIETISKHEVPF